MLSGVVPGLSRRVLLHTFRWERDEFYRDLAEMFRRGEAMLSFLEGEIANAQLTGQHSRARALRLALQRYQAGENAGQVSHVLAGVVPAGDAMLLMAVDRAADKPQALLVLADAVARQREMLRLMLHQASLPAVLLPITLLLIRLLSQVILTVDEATPPFAREALWTGFNGLARQLAELSMRHGTTVLALLLAAGLLLAWSLPRWRGAARLRVESWPVFSLYRDFQSSLLLSSMAMLLRSGETLQGGLEDLAQQASPWMRWHLGRVLAALDESPTAALDAFRRGLLSRWLLARAATLQRASPSFAAVLVQLGSSEGERVLRRVRQTALVANLSLVGLFAGAATVMGLASMTVPGQFASLMEPSTLMALKARWDAEHPAP